MNEELRVDLRPESHALGPLLDHLARYRGKQLRSALVFLAGKMFGRVTDAHYTCAKVVELIHTATLVHDDILDEAELRRQEPTVNNLHGNEVPVLLGDYIYALAFHMAVQLDDPTCARLFSEAVRVVCQGEITQCLHRGDRELDEVSYFKVISEKTASLYGTACRVGAYYAGADEAAVSAMSNFGMQLGVAFQIIDDCLDLNGEESVVGKSLGSDFGLGKMTLPLIRLLAESGAESGDRREQLLTLIGDEHCEGNIGELRRNFDVDGVIDYAMSQAHEWTERGLASLHTLPAGVARDAMTTLAEYVLRRNS